jgi:hypothetical protein
MDLVRYSKIQKSRHGYIRSHTPWTRVAIASPISIMVFSPCLAKILISVLIRNFFRLDYTLSLTIYRHRHTRIGSLHTRLLPLRLPSQQYHKNYWLRPSDFTTHLPLFSPLLQAFQNDALRIRRYGAIPIYVITASSGCEIRTDVTYVEIGFLSAYT